MGDAVKYLIFTDIAGAQARSAAAYAPLRSAGAGTAYLWSWRIHPGDGRAALIIPSTASETQIDIDQPSYEALFSSEEWTAMVDELAADWTVAAG